jgi:hypothetical protein
MQLMLNRLQNMSTELAENEEVADHMILLLMR